MIAVIKQLLTNDRRAQLLVAIFAFLTVWWAVLQSLGVSEVSEFRNLVWAALYQIIALLGGIWGVIIARSWGGSRSVVGQAILSFAIGLLLQVFGQSTFSLYNLVLQVDIPYPSLADLGFFGSIPFYIYGAWMLAKASGIGVSLRMHRNKIQALLIPLAMLIFSYASFLRGYEFDWSAPLRVILDYAYPLGQAIYVAIAILAYLLSRKLLGGAMKGRVIFILMALVVQYLADYNFLYQTLQETWHNGAYGDYIYLVAYFLMAFGLLQFKQEHIRSGNV